MIKRNFTFLLSVLFIFFCFNVNTATQDHIPKNILVGSYIGGKSHTKSMLEITEILIKRGYNAILLTSGNYTPSEYSIKQISLGPQFNRKNNTKIIETYHKEFDFKTIAMLQELGLRSYYDAFRVYNNTAKDYNIDLFFCDAMINEACLDVARTLKKPVVGFGSFLFVLATETYKSDPILHCNVSLENESFLERFKCTIIQPIRMFYLLYPLINQLNDIKKQINVEQVFISMRWSLKYSLFLSDTFFGFELPQPLPPNVQEIGPVLSDYYPPLTPKLSNFINKHERVLYVALGTHVSTTTENNNILLQSFIEAINKNIIDGVIWALVQTSKENFSSTLNLTDGTQIQTSSILNNKLPHIHIEKFAPQFAILHHFNTKLFFSHGGAGSSHESMYTGTPMLVLPFAGDQIGNAEKLKFSGIALTLNKFNLDVDDITSKMDLLLKDENVKKNAKRLEILTKINSKRKYRAADLIEYILYSSKFNEGVNEEFLKEWIPADTRMGFIRANNYDVYGALLIVIFGFVGGTLWITLRSIRFIVKKIFSPFISKLKRE